MSYDHLKKYKTLGVINRTPNSFSDHGASLDPDFFQTQLSTFLNDPSVIIDVGFESTAPMNSPIENSIELERFNEFLVASRNFSFKNRFISFDTYKPKNFLVMAHEFGQYHPEANFIFNDVSGVIDQELKDVLIQFKRKNFYYIYTYTHIPERSKVLSHMEYLDESKEIISSTVEAFYEAQKIFKEMNMDQQIIYDPGFGFSKSYEQNWKLIDSFCEFSQNIKELKAPILIGLSKKSFLKKNLSEKGLTDILDLERLHRDCIIKIQKSNTGESDLLFRVHDLNVL